MNNRLEKILEFVKKTGEKGIFFDHDGEYVLMKLDDLYSLSQRSTDFANLSEEEMLNRINRDIALWRESQREAGEMLDTHDLAPEVGDEEIWTQKEDFDDKEEDDEYFKEYYGDDKKKEGDSGDFEIDDLDGDDFEFDIEDDFKEEGVGDESVNNFGYSNPSDTNNMSDDDDFSDLDDSLADFSEEDEEEEEEYDIPPPPDVDKK